MCIHSPINNGCNKAETVVKKKSPMMFLAAALLFVVGLGTAYYAFELVSIPHVREYHEMRYLLVGITMTVAGMVLIFVKLRKRR
mgnify:CR=1 FL=1